MSKSASIISALLCTFIWGTTFIAQDTGMENIGPYVFNSVRFFVGFIALIPFYLFLEKKNTIKIITKNKKRFLILHGHQMLHNKQYLHGQLKSQAQSKTQIFFFKCDL